MKLEGSVAELVGGWKVWEETYGWKEAGTSKALAAKLENSEGLHQKCVRGFSFIDLYMHDPTGNDDTKC